jgi:hypothetical protein
LPDVTFLVVKFQSGKMVMLMITPMFVCLYDQQEPSLCASRPICFAPNYYISFAVMFCKKRERFAAFQYLQQQNKTKHSNISVHKQYRYVTLRTEMNAAPVLKETEISVPDCVTQRVTIMQTATEINFT